MRLGLLDFTTKGFYFLFLNVEISKSTFDIGFIQVASAAYNEYVSLFRFGIGRDESKCYRRRCRIELCGHKYKIYEW